MAPFNPTKFSRNHLRPLPGLEKVRELFSALVPLHEPAGQGPLSKLAADLARLSLRLEDRLAAGPEAPVIVAVLGATGTGKSKIFNSLAGSVLSPSGFRRPTTMAPVFYGPAGRLEGFARPTFFPGYEKRTALESPVAFSPEPARELILLPSQNSGGGGLVLVDTPDFDSVLASNRAAARDVFDRADAIIFVTDAVKYADQAAWEYLELIRDRNKEAVLIVNRLKNPLSREDFSRRLAKTGLDRTVLSLADQAHLSDEDLLEQTDLTLAELKNRLAEWSGPRRLEILSTEAASDWQAFEAGLARALLPQLAEASTGLSSLKTALNQAARNTREDLTGKLAVSISGELKQSLIAQIQTLFLKWDLLRYPRRIIGLPFNLLKDKVLVPMGVMSAGGSRATLDQEIDRLFEANAETMAGVIRDLNAAARNRFQSVPVGRGLAERKDFESLAFSVDQVRRDYAGVRTDLEAWVEGQARELVKGLDLGEKMTFYLAQGVSLGLFISIQVHTGGGFSFFDGVLDGVLAPILSKITGHALSRDKVKAFEMEAGRRHLKGCQGLIDAQERAYLDYLAEAEQGLAAAKPLRDAVAELTADFKALA